MRAEERRKQIIQLLRNASEPLSGSEIAGRLGVSRQLIVGDIALLRANSNEIISTYKGYLIPSSAAPHTRCFKVFHAQQDVEEEMNCIVDAGGKILDVEIEHPVYGRISAPLNVYSRADVAVFLQKMQEDHALPLSRLTSGEHYHTISGYSEAVLDDVEKALASRNFLAAKGSDPEH